MCVHVPKASTREELAVPIDSLSHPSGAKHMPHERLRGGDHWLAEALLEGVDEIWFAGAEGASPDDEGLGLITVNIFRPVSYALGCNRRRLSVKIFTAVV